MVGCPITLPHNADRQGQELVSAPKDRPLPVIPLVAAFLVMFDTIVGIKIYQAQHPRPAVVAIDSSTVLRTRDLRFVDSGDGMSVYGGHVSVYDAKTGAAYPPLRENEGFIRAVLNSLSFERTKRSVNAAPIFRLTYWSDKKVTLEDLATGKHVGLGQFGAKNEAVFMRFFAEPEARS
jgi:putative photosynthetic complex assembly protein